MKKYLLVSLTILFTAAFIWAEAATRVMGPDIDVDASATVTWGIDLGSGDIKAENIKHGFKNKASWEVKFPLIKKGNISSEKGEARVYADIALKDIELNLKSENDAPKFATDGKVGKLAAKFVFYDAYLQVYNRPDFYTDYASLWDPLIKSEDYNDKKKDVTYRFKPSFEGYGTKIGYANKNIMGLDVGLKFASNGSWDAKKKDKDTSHEWRYLDGETAIGKKERAKSQSGTIWGPKSTPDAGWYDIEKTEEEEDAVHGKYSVGLDFAMTPLYEMLGIKLNVNSTLAPGSAYDTGVSGSQDKNKYVFNVGAEVKSQPIADLNFKLGFDGGYAFEGNAKRPVFAWDMLFKTDYKWVGGGLYVASEGTPYAGYDGKNGNKRITDLAMFVQFATKGDKKESSYLVNGLDAGVNLGFYNILTYARKNAAVSMQLPMLMKLWGSYKVALNDSMSIKPFAILWVENNHQENKNGKVISTITPYTGLAYEVGVTYAPAEKVELTAKWEHGELNENEYGDLRTKDGKSAGKLIKAPANAFAHNGRFTFALKVTY